MSGAYAVVKQLESALCDYTGAPYAVTVNSCTMALLLAVRWHFDRAQKRLDNEDRELGHGMRRLALHPPIEIPSRTYVSVPQSIIHAGGRPVFRDEDWSGDYQLKPLPVWDCARRFTSGMFVNEAHEGTGFVPQFQCVSFHASKILGDTQGGAILHNDPAADAWLRRARFDGRTEGVAPIDDTFTQIGWHCYMSNDVAARLLHKLAVLPRHNEPLPNDSYPDLSAMDIFK